MTRWTAALVLAIIVALAAAGVAKEWIPLSDSPEPMEATARIISSDAAGTVVELEVPGLEMEHASRVLTGSVTLDIPGARRLNRAGAPDLPVYTWLLAIPDFGGVDLVIDGVEERVLEGYEIEPLESFRIEGEDAPETTPDVTIYAKDALFPAEIATVSDPMVMRDLRLVQLRVNPVRWNPVTGDLVVTERVRVRLDHSRGEEINPKGVVRTWRSEAFEPLYRSLVDNYDSLPVLETKRGSYLVITMDSVAGQLDEFIDWKNQRGVETHLTLLSEIGVSPSSTDVKNYIANAYSTWDNPPDYVCLVGDRDAGMPAWFHEGDITDHPYTELDGSDYFPDVIIGRMSVDTAQDAVMATLKVLEYERNCGATSDDWYSRALMVAANCCGNPQPVTPRTTSLRVAEMFYEHGYAEVDTLFWYYSNPTPPGTQDVVDAIDAGVSFVNYRGWGGAPGWYYPAFYADDVLTLSNGEMLPVMTSIVCGTGNWDSSTDPCFGEQWIRSGTPFDLKGGPAFCGPSEYWTHTKWNNAIDGGIYQGIFNDGLEHFGQALIRGKLETYMNYPEYIDPGSGDEDDQNVDFYFNVYNVIGDPELFLRTGTPSEFVVTYDTMVQLGENLLTVHVEDADGNPVPGAEVCVYNEDNDLQEVRTLTGGYNIDMPIFIENSGAVYVTVSGKNMKPHSGGVTVSQLGEFVGWRGHTIDDDSSGASSGNGDGVINPGETIELDVALENYGSATANGVTCTITEGPPRLASPYCTVPGGQVSSYGSIPPGSTYGGSTDFVFSVAEGCPDGTELGLEFTVTDAAGGTYVSYARVVVGAPTLAYYASTISGDGVLDPGETATLTVTLSNPGDVDATLVAGELSGPGAGLTIGDMGGTWGTVSAHGTATNSGDTFTVTAAPDVAVGHEFQLLLELTGGDGLAQFVVVPVTVGTVATDDPTGPDGYGYYAYDNTDTAYSEAPTYSWIECDSSYGGSGGVDLGLGDDVTVNITLPFEVRYYGDVYTDLAVCSNGWVALGGSPEFHHEFRNWFIPSPLGPHAMVAGLWDDLDPGDGGKVLTRDMGDGRFIVQWSRVPTAYDGNPETFEIILYDPLSYVTETGDSEIVFQYHTVYNGNSNANYATVGIEDLLQTDGVLYTYSDIYDDGAATLASGRAIKFTTDPPDGYDSTGVEDDSVTPKGVVLLGNQPNPFNPVTTVAFGMPAAGEVEIAVYDVAGRHVRTLLSGEKGPGYHSVVWDGMSDGGERVASGVYFARLTAMDEEHQAKMVLLK